MSHLEELNNRGIGTLPGLMGIEILEAPSGRLESRLELRDELMAPNGYLHAATVVALADTSCGYGCFLNLPEGAEGFTTVELKTNFLGTKLAGAIECEATMAHGGRTTQVWDATVTDDGKKIALFRCTQMILYPREVASLQGVGSRESGKTLRLAALFIPSGWPSGAMGH